MQKNEYQNIFIDLGANQGQATNDWKNYINDFKNWDCYAFEPVEMKWKANYPNVLKINKLAWIYDGELDLYIDKSRRQLGSSVNINKTTGRLDKQHAVKFPCIDIHTFILRAVEVCPNAHIVLKSNCEGAEYELLPYMLKKGTFTYIDELWIAYHNHKIKDFDQEIHNDLHENIQLLELDKYMILPDPCRGNIFKDAKNANIEE